MSSGALQPVRLGAQFPTYTPLPRPDGLTVSSLGEATVGNQAVDGPVPMVNYKTTTGMNTWYADRKATMKDCEYVCQQETDCLESSFDTVLASCSLFGRATTKPSPNKPVPSPAPLPSASTSAALSRLPSAVELRRKLTSSSSQPPPSATSNYTNPIVCSNSPDPGAIVAPKGPHETNRAVIIVATGGTVKSGAFPLWRSTDGGFTFELKRYALPKAPMWWDKEALDSVERMEAFFNGTHLHVNGSRKSGSLGSKRAREPETEKHHVLYAAVKLWAPEVRNPSP